MDVNVILEYVTYVKKSILTFYKIVLDKKYNKGLIEPLLENYLNVRYYNETKYSREKDLVERISKELSNTLKDIIDDKNEDLVKTIYALFGYVFYFDDCYIPDNDLDLLDTLFKDKNIKIDFTEGIKRDVTKFLKKFRSEKERYLENFKSDQFFLLEKRIYRNTYKLGIDHMVKISNLYSEYAIEKAFNMGTVNEDKMFILLAMTSHLVLENAISLDFSRKYVVDIPSSYFTKEKKVERLFRILDNTLAKKSIIISIAYKDYKVNKGYIDNLVKEGYSIGVIIDETFDEDYTDFILFSYVFVYDTYENYDMILNNKDKIATKLIVI